VIGFKLDYEPLKMLTDKELERIHQGTLEVLETTGLRIEHDKAARLLEKNGCQVDYDNYRVRFPSSLIDECLRKCPASFRVKARNRKNDLVIGGNRFIITTFPGTQIVDLNTWEPRTATKQEYCDGVRVLDALDNIHSMECYTPYFAYEGVPPVMYILEGFASRIRNTTKVLKEGFSNDSEVFVIDMAKAMGIDVIITIAPSPPLTYYRSAVEAIVRGADADLPLVISNGDIIGGSGPATIAGSSVNGNALIIGGIVLAQLIKPGTRIQVSNFQFIQNMRSGIPSFGAIEGALSNTIFCQYFRKLGIPTKASNVGATSSKKIDIQCGYQKAMLGVLAAVSGANAISLAGGIFGKVTFHPIQAILDDDIAGMIGRYIDGAHVNDETLALDLIDQVGPIPGFFLDKDHTRKWWTKEQYMPKVSDILSLPEWLESGKKSVLDYAGERFEEILTKHQPEPLTQKQEEDVERILEEARKFYYKKGLM